MPGAVSNMVSVPLTLPPAVGVKVTLMVHVALGATLLPAPQVVPDPPTAKSAKATRPLTVSETPPRF